MAVPLPFALGKPACKHTHAVDHCLPTLSCPPPLQIIEQGATGIASGVADGPPESHVGINTFAVLAVIIVIKAGLLAYCYGLRNVGAVRVR